MALPPTEPPVQTSLFFKLVRVVNLTARPFVEGIGKDEQLGLNEWRVMVVIAAFPGCPAQEVVAQTALDKMTVSRALAGLASQGYLLRAADLDDRRRTSLRLTAAGRKAYERVAESGRAREARLFAGISAAERGQLAKTLDRLTRNLTEDVPHSGDASESDAGRSPAEQARVRPRQGERLAALRPKKDQRSER